MKVAVVPVSSSVPAVRSSASRLRILAVFLPLLILATLTTDSPRLSYASDDGKFPVGVLSSTGSVRLDGRVDWGQGGRSLLPMIYDGTRIDLTSGLGTIELLMGGSLKLCHDADLTIQQYRSPYLLTLQRGTIAFDIPQSQGDVFLTPDFLIKIEPAPDPKPGNYRGEISLDSDGTICVRSQEGLLIVTTQDNSGTFTVPAGAGMTIRPGQVASLERFRDCSCADPAPKDELTPAAYRASGSKRQSRSFLRKLLKILTLGIL